jgi:hypothetical protein
LGMSRAKSVSTNRRRKFLVNGAPFDKDIVS